MACYIYVADMNKSDFSIFVHFLRTPMTTNVRYTQTVLILPAILSTVTPAYTGLSP